MPLSVEEIRRCAGAVARAAGQRGQIGRPVPVLDRGVAVPEKRLRRGRDGFCSGVERLSRFLPPIGREPGRSLRAVQAWRPAANGRLLGQPDGAFQQAAQNQMDDERAIRGHLLLGEAYLGLKQFQKGEEAMTRLGDRHLSPELNWQRLYLLARLQLAQQQIDPALQTVTNLLSQLSTVTNAAALNLQ